MQYSVALASNKISQDTTQPIEFNRYYNDAGFPMVSCDSTTFSNLYNASKLPLTLKEQNDSLFRALERYKTLEEIDGDVITSLRETIDDKNEIIKDMMMLESSYTRELKSKEKTIEGLNEIIKKSSSTKKVALKFGIGGLTIGVATGIITALILR